MGVGGSLPEAAGLEATHTSPLTAEVKTAPHYSRLLGVMFILAQRNP